MLDHHLKLRIPRMAATEEGIPPPLQLVEREYRKLEASPITAAPRTNTGSHIGVALTAEYILDDKCITSSAPSLKSVIIIAEKNPAAIEKPMHGMICFFVSFKSLLCTVVLCKKH